jgi:hypothetical protein
MASHHQVLQKEFQIHYEREVRHRQPLYHESEYSKNRGYNEEA